MSANLLNDCLWMYYKKRLTDSGGIHHLKINIRPLQSMVLEIGLQFGPCNYRVLTNEKTRNLELFSAGQ